MNVIGLDGLEYVRGDFSVADNTVLPTCQAESLQNDIGTTDIEGTVDNSGNDDGGSCL